MSEAVIKDGKVYIDGKLTEAKVVVSNGKIYVDGKLAEIKVEILGKGEKVETGIDGTKRWYLNGRLHRVDGPAIENANGKKKWYINGKHKRQPRTKQEKIEILQLKMQKLENQINKLRSKP